MDNRDAIIQGESKPLPFLIKSIRTGRPMLGLENASFLLWIKANKGDQEPVLIKEDTDFDKTLASTGNISVWLTAYDTYQLAPWTYYGELRITFTGSPVPLYKIKFELEIRPSDSPNDWVLDDISGVGSMEAVGQPTVAAV